MGNHGKPTAICDGENFFVDPDWWESLSPQERKGVREHERLHIAVSERMRHEVILPVHSSYVLRDAVMDLPEGTFRLLMEAVKFREESILRDEAEYFLEYHPVNEVELRMAEHDRSKAIHAYSDRTGASVRLAYRVMQVLRDGRPARNRGR